MTMKSFGLAAVALTCAVSLSPILAGSASAQSAPPNPATLNGMIHPGVPAGGGNAAAGTNAAMTTQAIATGWNYQHCYAAVYYTPDNVNYYEFAFNVEGTYFYYVINSPLAALAQLQLKNACDTGHQYAVYVTSASTGAYSEIQVGF
jgi:hypothetical protein